MGTEKTETLNLRVSAQFKELLRHAAQAEHRSQTNLLEKLVRDHCAAIGLAPTGAMAIPPACDATLARGSNGAA